MAAFVFRVASNLLNRLQSIHILYFGLLHLIEQQEKFLNGICIPQLCAKSAKLA